jgi:site-specific DNA-methyltransferase (adenine-specific)
MKNLEDIVGKVITGDCVEVMKELPKDTIDLIVTSPPYGVGIDYDVCEDDLYIDDYLVFTRNWLTQAFNLLKEGGRIALNIPYEINRQAKGGRIFIVSEVWQIMKEIGFGFYGIVDLEEQSPHRSKTTAWGSWMSPSSPYIYNPKECVILAYKGSAKKTNKGQPQWSYEEKDVEGKTKRVYSDEDKKEFIELVYGQWNYFADTKSMTKATFSMDIPTKAIKILTYKDDVVLDPFAGSGTSLVAAEVLDRKWIGIELSPNYSEVARKRVGDFILTKNQQEITF